MPRRSVLLVFRGTDATSRATTAVGTILVLLLSNLYEFAYGLPPIVTALLWIPILTASLTAILPVFMILSWQDKRWSVLGRLYYLLFILCAWGFISFLSYWNLLGFEF